MVLSRLVKIEVPLYRKDRDTGLDATPEEAMCSLQNTQSIEMAARLPPTETVSDPGIGGPGVRLAAFDPKSYQGEFHGNAEPTRNVAGLAVDRR